MFENKYSFFRINSEDKIVLVIILIIVIATWGFVIQKIPAIITLIKYSQQLGNF